VSDKDFILHASHNATVFIHCQGCGEDAAVGSLSEARAWARKHACGRA
jgi:hypothetical protein